MRLGFKQEFTKRCNYVAYITIELMKKVDIQT